jgi:hypothetical protein
VVLQGHAHVHCNQEDGSQVDHDPENVSPALHVHDDRVTVHVRVRHLHPSSDISQRAAQLVSTNQCVFACVLHYRRPVRQLFRLLDL